MSIRTVFFLFLSGNSVFISFLFEFIFCTVTFEFFPPTNLSQIHHNEIRVVRHSTKLNILFYRNNHFISSEKKTSTSNHGNRINNSKCANWMTYFSVPFLLCVFFYVRADAFRFFMCFKFQPKSLRKYTMLIMGTTPSTISSFVRSFPLAFSSSLSWCELYKASGI